MTTSYNVDGLKMTKFKRVEGQNMKNTKKKVIPFPVYSRLSKIHTSIIFDVDLILIEMI